MKQNSKKENLSQNEAIPKNEVKQANIELLDLFKINPNIRANKVALGRSEKGNKFTTKKILINKGIVKIDED